MNLDKDDKNSAVFFKAINIVLLVVVLSLGMYLLYTNRTRFESNRKESNTSMKSAEAEDLYMQKIIVDIGGAVKNPGVYEMSNDARIVDLIEKAGGLTEKVDLQYFDKNINKAQKLADGSKIYIPTLDDKPNAVIPTTTQTVPGKSMSSGLVNVNTASRKELIDLPEVGEVTADKIIAARPYNSLQELVTKGALRQSQLDKIKDKISY